MIQFWSMTDTGLVRKENQDAYGLRETTAAGYPVCVVCDGMGGSAGGQLASRIAVDTYLTELEKVLSSNMSPESLREAAKYAVSLANRAVWEAASASEEYANMGTTLVSAIICGDQAVLVNVGDSRAYHISNVGISHVTRDHSWVESMVEHGKITEEEARRHPNRNLITRALGPEATVECDGYIWPLAAGESLLLCSDGLVNTVTDQEMLLEVTNGDTDTCMDRLLAIAKSRGARDNVTAVLVRKA